MSKKRGGRSCAAPPRRPVAGRIAAFLAVCPPCAQPGLRRTIFAELERAAKARRTRKE